MPISKSKKEELVAHYVELLESSQGIIITQNQGMSMAEFNAIRAKLREIDSTYAVTKNTLLRLALEQAGMPISADLIQGPIAVAFAHNDLGATAKAVLDLDDEINLFLVQGAMVGETEYGADGVEALSKLPTMDEARAGLIGLIIAPAANIATLVNTPSSDLVSVISNGGATQILNVVAAYAAKEEAA